MKAQETLPQGPTWSFTELTAMLDLPWHWAVSYTRDMGGQRGIKPTVKVGKRVQYQHVGAAQFLLAKILSPQLSAKGVRYFLNHFLKVEPAPGLDRLCRGSYIVAEREAGPPMIAWFGPESDQTMKFAHAVRLLANNKFAVVRLDSVFAELQDRITAWEKRDDYKRRPVARKIEAAFEAIKAEKELR